LLEVILLGTGTSAPNLKRRSSGVCIQVDDEPFIFDLGAGTLHRMLEAGIDYKKVNRIFITHQHPDHCSDLIPFLFGTNYTLGFERKTPLSIYGPKGFKGFIKKMAALFPWITPKTYPLEIRELGKERIDQVKAVPVLHGGMQALSYRLEADGKAIVYSGDAGYCQDLIDIAQDADLLIIECSFPETMSLPKVHLNTADVGRIAKASNAKRVILTHLNPFCEGVDLVGQVCKIYSGVVEEGKDLMRIVI